MALPRTKYAIPKGWVMQKKVEDDGTEVEDFSPPKKVASSKRGRNAPKKVVSSKRGSNAPKEVGSSKQGSNLSSNLKIDHKLS